MASRISVIVTGCTLFFSNSYTEGTPPVTQSVTFYGNSGNRDVANVII